MHGGGGYQGLCSATRERATESKRERERRSDRERESERERASERARESERENERERNRKTAINTSRRGGWARAGDLERAAAVDVKVLALQREAFPQHSFNPQLINPEPLSPRPINSSTPKRLAMNRSKIDRHTECWSQIAERETQNKACSSAGPRVHGGGGYQGPCSAPRGLPAAQLQPPTHQP